MNTKRFTAAEIDFLRENSAKLTTTELAAALGRPYISISQKLRDMGLPRKLCAQGRKTDKWTGCNKTCPDFCPYDDCRMPVDEAAINYREDFKELFIDDDDE